MLNISSDRVDKLMPRYPIHSLSTLSTPRAGRILALWLIGIFILLVFCLFLPWQQNISGVGRITAFTPQDRPQTIETAIAGRVANWHVREGQFVRQGDTIMVISEIKTEYFDPELLPRVQEQLAAKQEGLLATGNKVEALTNQVQALREGMGLNLEQTRNRLRQAELKLLSDSADFSAGQINYQIAQRQFAGADSLFRNGLISLTSYEQRRQRLQETEARLTSLENQFLASQNAVLNARIEINSLQASFMDKIAKAQSERSSSLSYLAETEGELSKMRNYYANLVIRNDQYSILAPQDGFIVRALRAGIGETIKEGEAVVTIMPDSPAMAVEIFVRPMDLPLLQVGTPVRIEFDGWPALQFSGWPNVSVGTFGGRIAVIDYVNSDNGRYRVLAVPDTDEDPWPEQLRVGTGVFGWAMLNDVPVWYELWRQLNGFPPDLIPRDEQTDKSYQAKADSKDEKAKLK